MNAQVVAAMRHSQSLALAASYPCSLFGEMSVVQQQWLNADERPPSSSDGSAVPSCGPFRSAGVTSRVGVAFAKKRIEGKKISVGAVRPELLPINTSCLFVLRRHG